MLLEAECAPVVSIWDSLAMLRQTPDAKEKEILEMDVVEEIKKMGQIHNDIHSLLWKASLSLFGSIFRGFGIKHSSCKVKRKQGIDGFQSLILKGAEMVHTFWSFALLIKKNMCIYIYIVMNCLMDGRVLVRQCETYRLAAFLENS